MNENVPIEAVEVSAYRVPTDGAESDGTFEWTQTILVAVEITAGGVRSFGYTYADRATASLIDSSLRELMLGRDALDVPARWAEMVRTIRNLGRPGIASMAIAAVDNSLWDLKGRLLDLPLARLLGMARPSVPAYGSGGFTSYTAEELAEQLGGWAAQGLRAVKMKVGRDPEADPQRVRVARSAVGPDVALMVDANGAYARKQALKLASVFADSDVSWFEEPVSSDDLEGLRLIRDQGPPGMEIAAGEYGYDTVYFRRMLEAGAVDVLQADATRCAGITGFLQAATLAAAHGLGISAHTAPSLHTHVCCACPNAVNVEFFHDHARVEAMLLDGARRPEGGMLAPDLSRSGLGLELKRADAAHLRVYGGGEAN